jgi:pimeloyl-ACP methyl ester carboxylesterase
MQKPFPVDFNQEKYLQNVFSPQVENEARQALKHFLTPSKPQLSESEQVSLAEAISFSIPFGSIDINAFRWGTGPTILLVHGWGGYGLQLNEFINPLLEAGYQVLAFDAPAHGSTTGEQSNGFELAQAIETVVKHQNSSNSQLSQPIDGIIAHSLGATSTTLALSKGMKTRKVVYLGTMCWLFNALTLFAKRAKLSIEVSEALRYLFEEQFGQDVWQRLAVDQNAQNLKIPALLFHDRRDREVVFDESLTVSQVWSNARLIETVGLGHRRILRDGSVVQQTIDFMNTCSDPQY